MGLATPSVMRRANARRYEFASQMLGEDYPSRRTPGEPASSDAEHLIAHSSILVSSRYGARRKVPHLKLLSFYNGIVDGKGGHASMNTAVKTASRRIAYKKEFIDEMLLFFSMPIGDEYGGTLPSFVKFANSIGVTTATLLRWREKYPAFREAYEECRARLTDRLVDGVLARKYDASFVRAILSGTVLCEPEEADTAPPGITVRIVE